MTIDARLHTILTEQPYPLLFATISGAHLYGFPSPDSDFDLRGAHVLPLQKVIGLDVRDETVQDSSIVEGLEMDIVSHDVRKFFGLLLKKNGYVLEQLYSPLVVHTTPEHAELKAASAGAITKHHSDHYFGFSDTQWKLFCLVHNIEKLAHHAYAGELWEQAVGYLKEAGDAAILRSSFRNAVLHFERALGARRLELGGGAQLVAVLEQVIGALVGVGARMGRRGGGGRRRRIPASGPAPFRGRPIAVGRAGRDRAPRFRARRRDHLRGVELPPENASG
jgi:hypothetical protein